MKFIKFLLIFSLTSGRTTKREAPMPLDAVEIVRLSEKLEKFFKGVVVEILGGRPVLVVILKSSKWTHLRFIRSKG